MDMAARLQRLQDEKTEHRHVVLGIYCDAMEVSPDGSLSQSGSVTSAVTLNEACWRVVVLDDLHATHWLSGLDWRRLRTGYGGPRPHP